MFKPPYLRLFKYVNGLKALYKNAVSELSPMGRAGWLSFRRTFPSDTTGELILYSFTSTRASSASATTLNICSFFAGSCFKASSTFLKAAKRACFAFCKYSGSLTATAV